MDVEGMLEEGKLDLILFRQAITHDEHLFDLLLGDPVGPVPQLGDLVAGHDPVDHLADQVLQPGGDRRGQRGGALGQDVGDLGLDVDLGVEDLLEAGLDGPLDVLVADQRGDGLDVAVGVGDGPVEPQ